MSRPLNCLSLLLTQTYSKCSPHMFKYKNISKDLGKILSNSSVATRNDGLDNDAGDLIVKVGDEIQSPNTERKTYVIEKLLGRGSFGQVFRCSCKEDHNSYSIKIVKNLSSSSKQADVEKRVLKATNSYDKDDQHHMLRSIESFIYQNHYCFVTELYGTNLYQILKQNGFCGFPLPLLANLILQILESLIDLWDLNIIHCDLKPENILVDHCLPSIRVIDFGSASFNCGKKELMYVQSRYYRCPEVLLLKNYDCLADMWSLGCLAAELFIGHPLFPGSSEYEQVVRITRMLGPFPHDFIEGSFGQRKFFTHTISSSSAAFVSSDFGCVSLSSASPACAYASVLFTGNPKYRSSCRNGFTFISREEYVRRTNVNQPMRKYAYIKDTLEETMEHKIHSTNSMVSKEDILNFVQFLHMCLRIVPAQRLTPRQAYTHPFIRRSAFVQAWRPKTEDRLLLEERQHKLGMDKEENIVRSLHPLSSVSSSSYSPPASDSTVSIKKKECVINTKLDSQMFLEEEEKKKRERKKNGMEWTEKRNDKKQDWMRGGSGIEKDVRLGMEEEKLGDNNKHVKSEEKEKEKFEDLAMVVSKIEMEMEEGEVEMGKEGEKGQFGEKQKNGDEKEEKIDKKKNTEDFSSVKSMYFPLTSLFPISKSRSTSGSASAGSASSSSSFSSSLCLLTPPTTVCTSSSRDKGSRMPRLDLLQFPPLLPVSTSVPTPAAVMASTAGLPDPFPALSPVSLPVSLSPIPVQSQTTSQTQYIPLSCCLPPDGNTDLIEENVSRNAEVNGRETRSEKKSGNRKGKGKGKVNENWKINGIVNGNVNANNVHVYSHV